MTLVLAMLLDAILGEPKWLWSRLPHPAILMGRTVERLTSLLNAGQLKTVKGTLTITVLVIGAGLIGLVLSAFGPLAEIVVVAVLLAQRSLVDHVRTVADGLRMSLAQGRRDVAMIVSRDTSNMTPSAVARSAIESAAENLSDGVIAPAFWFLVAGLPGLLIYKAVNTADSMIGYRTAQFEQFGKAAARLDDVMNWVPARLTALLIALPGGVVRNWPVIMADARLHRSPNAGWPEAAMAQANDVALAGPRSYDGAMQSFAWVNEGGKRDLGPSDIDAAITRLWQAWALMLGATLLVDLL